MSIKHEALAKSKRGETMLQEQDAAHTEKTECVVYLKKGAQYNVETETTRKSRKQRS